MGACVGNCQFSKGGWGDFQRCLAKSPLAPLYETDNYPHLPPWSGNLGEGGKNALIAADTLDPAAFLWQC